MTKRTPLANQPAPTHLAVRALAPPRRRWQRATLLVAAIIATLGPQAATADDALAIERRLAADARHLASDELEGRGLGTKGIDLAAEHIANEFQTIGLQTALFEGSAYQTFTVTTTVKIGPSNELTLQGPPEAEGASARLTTLKPGEDFTPMAASGTGTLDLPVVFVGYGITAPDQGYDDYAGIDVKGKAVIILRHEPQQDNPHSKFNGTEHSAHAPLSRKIANAFEHSAAAVIFCTDAFEIDKKLAIRKKQWRTAFDELCKAGEAFEALKNPLPSKIAEHAQKIEELIERAQEATENLRAEADPVLPFLATGPSNPRDGFPIVHCRREIIDRMLRAACDTDLATLEKQIDEGPSPQSRELPGWRVTGRIDVIRKQVEAKNVVGVLPGKGPLADEVVVVGAHYDHLGFGGHGSLVPQKHEVHNGADDNASGVAVLIEVARQLAAQPEKLRRSVMFVAFTGEERGLLGSAHYVHHPLFPLEKTVAMLNMDMVGRLRDDKLIVTGTDTSTAFVDLLDKINEKQNLTLVKRKGGFSPSDQTSFYARKIPVLHFFTGTHKDYHRPSDDFEKLNVPGMRRVTSFVAAMTEVLANVDQRPDYVAVAMPKRSGGTRPYLGTIPDFGNEKPGYAISGVAKGGPAERAGLQGGDSIVQFGDSKIGGLEDIDSALRKYKAGDTVRVVVLRDGQNVDFQITLDPPH